MKRCLCSFGMLALLLLTGCVVRPLYEKPRAMRNTMQGTLAQQLAKIEVCGSEEIFSQKLKHRLDFLLHGCPIKAAYAYRLNFHCEGKEQSPYGASLPSPHQHLSGLWRGQILYFLVDKKNGKTVLQDCATAIVPFDYTAKAYGNISAVSQAQEQAVEIISQHILLHLAEEAKLGHIK